MHRTPWIILVVFLLHSSGILRASGIDTASVSSPRAQAKPMQVANPAAWINDCYNRLNDIYLSRTEMQLDTAELLDRIHQHSLIVDYLMKDFYSSRATMTIRSIYNLKMRVADILSNLDRWQGKVHKMNEKLVDEAREVLLIRKEINEFNEQADSMFKATFLETLGSLTSRQRAAEESILKELKYTTNLENKTIKIKVQVYTFHTDLYSELKNKESLLLKRELPPIWRSPVSVYKYTIGEVIASSFRQTLDSVGYYGEMSLWRIVIFRTLIFLICLLPIRIFNDQVRKKKILESTNLTFLGEFPKSASLVMGLAFAPIVFVHPPHAFMEFILIGLIFTVSVLALKMYPKIDKGLMITILAAFLLLYLINFFVTPTYIGRLLYSCSILLLIPVFIVFRRIPAYGLKYEKTVRFFFIFLAIHLFAGWIFVISGRYTLGRSIILAGYNLLIIIMIMRIAIYTILDYSEIIIYFLNKNNSTLKINSLYLRTRLKPFLFLLAIVFIVIAYLFTLSIFEILKSSILNYLLAPRQVGSVVFTFKSILLFFLWIYFAFLISSTLRFLFEPQYEQTSRKRSNIGSYLLIFRMFVLCSGVVLGILASGLPLSNFTVFLGAIGVGIGFGLQSIVGNLVAGVIIAIERPFVVGDILDFGTETGRVKEISMRATMISTFDQADILIPNSTFLSQELKNWTISSKERTIEFKIHTTSEADPSDVIATIGQCLNKQPNIIRERSLVYFTEISDSGFIFTVRILITDLKMANPVRSQVLSDIQASFTEKGVRFFQRTFPAEN